MFELEDLHAALARFEELRPDPPRIPPNAATRANDRALLAVAAGDRKALRAFASLDFRFEDRGKRALVVGDVGVWVDSALFLGTEHTARLEPELLATIGDRIAVYRDVWSGTAGGGSFELNHIRVFELDEEQKLRALLIIDDEDRAAAFSEALARFATGEAAGCVPVGILAAFLRAINVRDWIALREIYTPDFALTDHRPLGLGALTRDAWIASLQATVDLSVGLAFEVAQVLAWSERGMVVVLRRHGSVSDGGGPFENFPIGVSLNRGDRISRYELFEDTDADRALARFAELCASDPQA
jgi:ketosteroid isomerase-like protein